MVIIGKGRSAMGTGYNLADKSDGYDLGLHDGVRICWCTTTDYPANNWNHIVATWDGNTMKIYVNGQLKNVASCTISSLIASSEPLNIGRETSGLGRYYEGSIDGVRLYNRSLLQEEIQLMYLSPYWATDIFRSVQYTGNTPQTLASIRLLTPELNSDIFLTLSDQVAGQLATTLTSSDVVPTFANGVWHASGNTSEINSLLSGLIFEPSANYYSDFTIGVYIEDGVNTPVISTITVGFNGSSIISDISSIPGDKQNLTVILGAVIGGTIVVVGMVVGGVVCWRRNSQQEAQHLDEIVLEPISPVESKKEGKKKKMPVEFGQVIGQGGFGTVLRGTWRGKSMENGPRKGQEVAIKELPENLAQLPDMVTEFEKEAELMRRCDHENVIRCYTFFLTPRCCIVMPIYPYVLDKILDSLQWYPEGLRIVNGITKGLHYLHEQLNIIHRDIKPSNILIKGDKGQRVPVITDLGTARVKQQTLATMTKGVGTPAYIAPEILEGETSYTNKVDVYSYGLLMWAIYTGIEPFQGYEHFQLSQYISEGGRPEIPKECPHSFASLMSKCWAQRAEERPSMQQVAKELETVGKDLMEMNTEEYSASLAQMT
jgi:hypothetical protein